MDRPQYIVEWEAMSGPWKKRASGCQRRVVHSNVVNLAEENTRENLDRPAPTQRSTGGASAKGVSVEQNAKGKHVVITLDSDSEDARDLGHHGGRQGELRVPEINTEEVISSSSEESFVNYLRSCKNKQLGRHDNNGTDHPSQGFDGEINSTSTWFHVEETEELSMGARRRQRSDLEQRKIMSESRTSVAGGDDLPPHLLRLLRRPFLVSNSAREESDFNVQQDNGTDGGRDQWHQGALREPRTLAFKRIMARTDRRGPPSKFTKLKEYLLREKAERQAQSPLFKIKPRPRFSGLYNDQL